MERTNDTQASLLYKAQGLTGLSFEDLARMAGTTCPKKILNAKGWFGLLLERILGAESNSKPIPDFSSLGIELKTLPLHGCGEPKESTYVTYAPIPFTETDWANSTVLLKMKKILWFPYLAEGPIAQRRIAQPFLWQMSPEWSNRLQQDWNELTEKLKLCQFEDLTAKTGKYLQIRPKAPNSKTFIQVLGAQGEILQVVPKGFYLRPLFTQAILREQFG